MLRREALMMAVLGVMAARPSRAAFISAPDVVVYCDTTLMAVMRELGADYHRRAGIPVRVFGAIGKGSLRLIAHGGRNDVVVTQADWLDQAATERLVHPATRVGAWRDATVLAGRNAATLPALPSPPALAGLLAGRRLGVIDPTFPGGPDGVALAGRLGWQVPLAGEIDGPGVAFLVRQGAAGLGLLPRSAAAARPALAVLAAVPDGMAPPVAYAAAASKNTLSRNTASFLDYLKTSVATAILHDAGLETAA